MSKKVYILKGLPASGKGVLAEQMIKDAQPNSIKRINKDLLREMFDFGVHTGKSEGFIIHVRNILIGAALSEGKSVIVDDTNLNPIHEDSIRRIVTERNKAHKEQTSVEVIFLDTPIEECISRDLKRAKSVGERVIRQMHNQWIAPKWAPAPIQEDLPDAIIVDIDGTVAEMVNRTPYEWDKVQDDAPKKDILELVQAYSYSTGAKVIFLSGRDGDCYEQTNSWLKANLNEGAEYLLYMRPAKDTRQDSIVKEEIYNAHIKGKYNVKLVFDDRLQVCRLWWRLGLQLLRVGDPEAYF